MRTENYFKKSLLIILFVSFILPNITSAQTTSASISFGQNVVTTGIGQTQNISITGTGIYGISSNSNTAVASATINGSVLAVTGISAGTTDISVCASSLTIVSCGKVSVTVSAAPVSNTTSETKLAFSENDITMTNGQKKSITVSGGPSNAIYYVSVNSMPSVVTVNPSGSIIELTALTVGGSNITVCSTGAICGNFYVYVRPSDAPSPLASTNLALSSFTFSSDDLNGDFLARGNTITISLTANQIINPPTLVVSGSVVPLNGVGKGPYTGTYIMKGTESVPLAVSAMIINSSGGSYRFNWTLGNPSNTYIMASANQALATPTPVPVPAQNVSTYKFTRDLSVGSIGEDVMALQRYLADKGFYSGPFTGKYGILTTGAVRKYQQAHNVSSVGVVGPITRSMLNQGQ